jgi:hypothetical protein
VYVRACVCACVRACAFGDLSVSDIRTALLFCETSGFPLACERNGPESKGALKGGVTGRGYGEGERGRGMERGKGGGMVQ